MNSIAQTPTHVSAQERFNFLWVPSVHPEWLTRMSWSPNSEPVASPSRLDIALAALDYIGDANTESVATEVRSLVNASWVVSNIDHMLHLAECTGVAGYLASKQVRTSVELSRQLAQMLGERVADKRHQLGSAFDLPRKFVIELATPVKLDPVNFGAGLLIAASSVLGGGVEARVRLKLPVAAGSALADAQTTTLDKLSLGRLCEWIEAIHHASED